MHGLKKHRAWNDIKRPHIFTLAVSVDSIFDLGGGGQDRVFAPGSAAQFIRSLVSLNVSHADGQVVELVMLGVNSHLAAIDFKRSLSRLGIDPRHGCFVLAAKASDQIKTLNAVGSDLYISTLEQDVRMAITAGKSAVVTSGQAFHGSGISNAAVDGDVVIAWDFDRTTYRAHGAPGTRYESFDADTMGLRFKRLPQSFGGTLFERYEARLAHVLAHPGPVHRGFLQCAKLELYMAARPVIFKRRIRSPIVTARSKEMLGRVHHTLAQDGVGHCKVHACGLKRKGPTLRRIRAIALVDDKPVHTADAEKHKVTGFWVPSP